MSTTLPGAGPGLIRLGRQHVSPFRAIGIRVGIAFAVLFAVILIVYLDRNGYRDTAGGPLSFLDAAYYATVSLSTTGYGDIVPVSNEARLVNIFLITPLRILFLIVLVGTTLEALTFRTREDWRVNRWRATVKDHVVVIGYGVKGRSAVKSLLAHDFPRSSIVVVDPSQGAINEANAEGLVGVVGDATRLDVLQRAGITTASRIIVSAHRDDTAVLVTLTARSVNPNALIVASVREEENATLLRSSGADSVITSSDSVGRLLGIATLSPPISDVLEDLLSPEEGLEVAERPAVLREEGQSPAQVREPVLAVVRDGKVLPYYDPSIGHLLRGDRLVVVRPSQDLPWAPKVVPED